MVCLAAEQPAVKLCYMVKDIPRYSTGDSAVIVLLVEGSALPVLP